MTETYPFLLRRLTGTIVGLIFFAAASYTLWSIVPYFQHDPGSPGAQVIQVIAAAFTHLTSEMLRLFSPGEPEQPLTWFTYYFSGLGMWAILVTILATLCTVAFKTLDRLDSE